MSKYDIIAIGFLIVFVCVFLFSEIVVFSKYKWSFTEEELKKENKKLKKNMVVFAFLAIIFPFVMLILNDAMHKLIPLINYLLIFMSVSFGLSLSTQVYKYFKINRKNNKLNGLGP